MPRGPLPKPEARRRNAPTIPTTSLPAAGRGGDPPDVPAPVELGQAGEAWWNWAWATPQAAAWDDGAVHVVARRAALEDDLAALAEVDALDLLDVLDEEVAARFKAVIRRLAALLGGRLAILKEMREVDRTLGLTPKAMAELRWAIVAPEQPAGLRVVPTAPPEETDPRRLLA